MDLGLRGRIALVTGSSKGLGKAVAFKLAAEGCEVVISSRNNDNLQLAASEIAKSTGKEITTIKCDVTDKAEIEALKKTIIKKFARLDILVCNAGGPPAGYIDDFETPDYRDALELNLISTVSLCNAFYPIMKKHNWGRIINITSISVKQPIDNLILSNTARTGVIGFSKSLSNQLAPFGITVNAVCPGYTDTERVAGLAKSYQDSGKGTERDFYRNISSAIPMGRMAKPGEFADAVTFLASERAGYITGIALQIDGGFYKGLY